MPDLEARTAIPHLVDHLVCEHGQAQSCKHCGDPVGAPAFCAVLLMGLVTDCHLLSVAACKIEKRAGNRDWSEDPNAVIADMGGIAARALAKVDGE